MILCLELFVLSALFVIPGLDTSQAIEDGGFTFDMPEESNGPMIEPATTTSKTESSSNRHEAILGRLFHFTLHGERQGYLAKLENSKPLPHWLIFNKKTGTFWGIPLPGDEGTLRIIATPLGSNKSEREELVIDVLKDSDTTTPRCKSNEDNTFLALLIDRNIRAIKPKQRVIAISNIAKFFRLPYSAFILKSQFETDDITDSSVVLAGPGNIHVRSSKMTSYLEVLVGCDGRLWESSASLIHNLKQQARDGTLTEVLGLPLIGWRVKTETKPALRSKRQTVDDYGSGDYDDDYYDYDNNYAEGEDLGDVESNPPTSSKPVTHPSTPESTSRKTTTFTTSTTTLPTSTHPHRHHHGETKPLDAFDEDMIIDPEEPVFTEHSLTTSTTTTQKPNIESGPTIITIPNPQDALDADSEYDYDAYEDEDDPDEDIESETTVPDITGSRFIPENTTPEFEIHKFEDDNVEPETERVTVTEKASTVPSITTSTTSESPTTFEIVEDTEPPTFTVTLNVTNAMESTTLGVPPVEISSPPPTTTASTTSTTTLTSTQSVVEQGTLPVFSSTEYPTTQEHFTTKTSTPKQISTSTVTEEMFVSETVESVNKPIPEVKNTKPYIENRLQFKSVTAGKVFRFEIPFNTFRDTEDGYNLTLQVLDSNEQPITRNSWLQFNPARRELYGLPLAEDVSNWVYMIRAIDHKGAYEQDQLTIQVQQHRLERVVNHEFLLTLRIEKPQEYIHYVDWSLKILRALGRIYGTNMSEITVRHINHTSEPVEFAWSNDSLPTSYCSRSEIDELFKKLTANDRGDPSRELSSILAPDLRVKRIVNRDLTICEQQPVHHVTPTTNFSPILRNPVDKVNATLGELLIFKVKDDTFYDPEDVDSSTLNITLLTADLEAIPPTNWLQFDSKNREFYGIPRKIGRSEYFLLCVDTGGMSAKDSLEVIVNPSVKRQYNVEFSMTIGVPFEIFSNSPTKQRKFVEKLMEIFEESTPSNFYFLPFKAKREVNFDSTLVHWFNKSLPVDSCPTDEIKHLEYLLHSDSRSISSRVHRIMGPEFTVSTIKVHHIGNCKSKPQVVPAPDVIVPSQETPRPQAESDMMITLVLPIVIISIMVFVALIAACVLYRKRRMGKMNVEEDGRQSYGNKGIPVIFQEELEEKPEPGTKAPVILKDEKPPLAPPEYSKSGSLKLEDSEPYQPPPPFTRTQDNGRQSRPKPTPTYRKPPPYVPP
ncbi:hypothetical protein ABEB36_007445 [Hypothenemus hampei]|uniref:Dystroglycan 1 n=1 Tax=Hypothenemus hampei TaxID=57062 RepID=A0ABD1ETZ9_HYPHA